MTDPPPRVTISLVTWNGMRWLPGCLDSVVAQTLTDWELLIIDNASVDGSGEWLARWADADPRKRLIREGHNTGHARAHNRSIRVARGAAVLLLKDLIAATRCIA